MSNPFEGHRPLPIGRRVLDAIQNTIGWTMAGVISRLRERNSRLLQEELDGTARRRRILADPQLVARTKAITEPLDHREPPLEQ